MTSINKLNRKDGDKGDILIDGYVLVLGQKCYYMGNMFVKTITS